MSLEQAFLLVIAGVVAYVLLLALFAALVGYALHLLACHIFGRKKK